MTVRFWGQLSQQVTHIDTVLSSKIRTHSPGPHFAVNYMMVTHRHYYDLLCTVLSMVAPPSRDLVKREGALSSRVAEHPHPTLSTDDSVEKAFHTHNYAVQSHPAYLSWGPILMTHNSGHRPGRNQSCLFFLLSGSQLHRYCVLRKQLLTSGWGPGHLSVT